MYLALGGPGVGKTSGRVVECIQDVCRQGEKRALLVSSLCKVRNLHVAMLQSALDAAVFSEQVRVVGSRGLDKLARSRTLPALVWQRMEPVVAAHEDRRIGLRTSLRQRRVWPRSGLLHGGSGRLSSTISSFLVPSNPPWPPCIRSWLRNVARWKCMSRL